MIHKKIINRLLFTFLSLEDFSLIPSIDRLTLFSSDWSYEISVYYTIDLYTIVSITYPMAMSVQCVTDFHKLG